MPPSHRYIIIVTFILYWLTAGVTFRDRVLVSALHQIERYSIYEPSGQSLFENAMAGLFAAAGDDYSMYLPPKESTEYEDGLNNRYGGIGIRWLQTEQKQKNPVAAYSFPESPAFLAGIRSGDTILTINGVSTDDKSFNEIFGLISKSTSKTVKLALTHFDETEPVDISVSPAMIQRGSIEGGYIDAAGHRVCRLETVPEIGYIRITSFSETTAAEMAIALTQITNSTPKTAAVKSLILDLRDNPGGFIHTAIAVVRMFVEPTADQDMIVTAKYRHGSDRTERLQPGECLFHLPMVVLINEETASAAEILAAALQDYHRAEIIGSRSFGKGIIQTFWTLPFGFGMVQLTCAEYIRPSGQNIHRLEDSAESDIWGVMPNIKVEIPEEQRHAVMQYRDICNNLVTTKRDAVLATFRSTLNVNFSDEQLDKAVEVLRKPAPAF